MFELLRIKCDFSSDPAHAYELVLYSNILTPCVHWEVEQCGKVVAAGDEPYGQDAFIAAWRMAGYIAGADDSFEAGDNGKEVRW